MLLSEDFGYSCMDMLWILGPKGIYNRGEISDIRLDGNQVQREQSEANESEPYLS